MDTSWSKISRTGAAYRVIALRYHDELELPPPEFGSDEQAAENPSRARSGISAHTTPDPDDPQPPNDPIPDEVPQPDAPPVQEPIPHQVPIKA